MSDLPGDLALALRLADRADSVTTAAFRRADLRVETKADRTPVTEADREVEAAIRRVLAEDRPDDQVLGEEFGDTAGPEGDSAAGTEGDSAAGPEAGRRNGPNRPNGPNRRWIIDPIDGTKNFVRRNPVWATLLALEVDGQVAVGVVSAPALGRRWWAARGHGAWVGTPATIAEGDDADQSGARRIEVSKVADLADAHLSGTTVSDWDDWGGPGAYVDLALRCYADRNFGDFWSHMLVAEGVCDIGLDPVVSLWDLAPLQVIVEEAGGRFTDFAGVARPDGGSAISSNGLLHDQALSVLTARGS